MIAAHERDMASWAAEWLLLPQAFIMTDGALTQLLEVVTGLEVDQARMAQNLELTSGAILAEAVMLALGRQIGRDPAHHVLREASLEATERGVPLLVALSERNDVRAYFTPDELAHLLDPARYLGEASRIAADVAARHRAPRTSTDSGDHP